MNIQKYPTMKVKSLFTCLAAILLTVVTAASCDNYLGIDDDLDDCGYNYNITYRLNLITNMDEEIDYVLYAPADAYVKEALRTEWGKIFREYGYSESTETTSTFHSTMARKANVRLRRPTR